MQVFSHPESAILVILVVVALSVVLGGCKSLNQRSIDNDFPGVQAAMEGKPIICLLFVHGIGGYSNDDPAHFIDMIGKMPHMESTSGSISVPLADTVGKLKRQDFVDKSNNHQLRVYTLDWESVTDPLKTQFLGYDQSTENVAARLPVLNDLRKSLLDNGIPDVVLYVGEYKSAIQGAVKQALRQIHTDLENRPDQQNDYEYVFVTWSLGSKIVFDCLADPRINAEVTSTDQVQASADEVTFNKIAEKTHSVFMLANQLPLLTLGDIKSPRQTNLAPTTMPYQNLLSVARRRKAATTRVAPATTRLAAAAPASQPSLPQLSIVAFSDPNDLLSYPIPPWLEQMDDADFANVSISVAKTAYYIPFVGWILNPDTAHTAYGIRDDVVNLVLYGSKTKPVK